MAASSSHPVRISNARSGSACQTLASEARYVQTGPVDPADPLRESHVAEEVGLLHVSVNELMQAANALAERLRPIMRDETDPQAEDALDSYRVPLASDIRSHRRGMQSVTNQLRRLMELIEL